MPSNRAYATSRLRQLFRRVRIKVSQSESVALMTAAIGRPHASRPIIVSIVGGAASGKSTLAEELVAYLQSCGRKADLLCTDNYVIGDRHYRQVLLKDQDAHQKYDLALMDRHVDAIRRLEGDATIEVPLLDPASGRAVDRDRQDQSYRLGRVDTLIIEGDLPRHDYDIRFYIHMPDEQRRQRNLARELDRPAGSDEKTLNAGFDDRQRTLHKPYTLPALEAADMVLVVDDAQESWHYDIYERTAHA